MASIDPTGGVATGSMIPGLISGMDTASLVEKMLSGTQSKIDTQYGKKQQIEWKQEIYRDIITKLDNFRTKFFSYSSSSNTNLLSSAFYNAMNTVSSSNAVKVISTSSQAGANINISEIKQLATACKVTGVKVSKELTGEITDEALKNMAGQELSIDVSLDGVKKTIRFQGADNMTDLTKNLKASLESSFGTTIEAVGTTAGNKNILSIEAKGDSHTVVLMETKDSNSLSQLGFSDGASNKLSYGTMLKDSPFATALQGDTFEFSINGTVIKAGANDTIGDVISRINSSDAGVRVTYNSITDKFTMESKTTGDVSGIDIKQTKGNLLSAMFGYGTGSGMTVSTAKLRTTDPLTGSEKIDDTLLNAIMKAAGDGGQSLKLHVNGQAVEVLIPSLKEGETYDKTSFVQAINDQLEKGFGAGNVVLSETADGKMQIQSADGYLVSLYAGDQQHNLNDAFGLVAAGNAPMTQAVTEKTTLGELGISGKWKITVDGAAKTPAFQLDSSWTMEQLTEEFNKQGAGTMKYDAATQTISISDVPGNVNITGQTAGDSGEAALHTLFGQTSMEFNSTGNSSVTTQGKNAILTVDGSVIERNSNQFEINGVTVQLTAEYGCNSLDNRA